MTNDAADRNRDIWEDRLADTHASAWEIDPAEGVVQGPLDLAFLSGKRIDLSLPCGMVALLAERGELQRCFMDGAHHLGVGDGEDELPTSGLLYFFDLAGDLELHWRQHLALRPSEAGDGGARPARGRFRVRIIDATSFYEAFLRGKAGAGEDICRDALAHLLPTFLAIHLARTSPERLDGRDLREQIADLDPAALDAQLAPYGLTCLEVEAALDGVTLDGVALPAPAHPC